MIDNLNSEELEKHLNQLHKEVVAHANTHTGCIKIRVQDFILNPKDIDLINFRDRIKASIKEAIYPDVDKLLECSITVYKQEPFIEIIIIKGPASPYFLLSQGCSPHGVFLKYGKSTSPASEVQIQKMIDSKTSKNYEEIRANIQKLSFTCFESMCKNLNLVTDKKKTGLLGTVDDKSCYTNLALLLSDQCTHTIRITVFEGINKSIPKVNVELKGSVLKQIEEGIEFIDRYNSRGAITKGLKRIDTRSYPELALREVFINLVLHRNYKKADSPLICIYADRIEFISNNGLIDDISKNDILLGASFLRNKKLGKVFHELKIAQLAGTGVSNIFESYLENVSKPLIEVSDNVFKLTLFNIQYEEDKKTKVIKNLSEKEKSVIDLFFEKNSLKRAEIQTELSISQQSAINFLKSLKEKNLIISEGTGKNTKYMLKK